MLLGREIMFKNDIASGWGCEYESGKMTNYCFYENGEKRVN